jgi:hypothetical protein
MPDSTADTRGDEARGLTAAPALDPALDPAEQVLARHGARTAVRGRRTDDRQDVDDVVQETLASGRG